MSQGSQSSLGAFGSGLEHPANEVGSPDEEPAPETDSGQTANKPPGASSLESLYETVRGVRVASVALVPFSEEFVNTHYLTALEKFLLTSVVLTVCKPSEGGLYTGLFAYRVEIRLRPTKYRKY